MQLEGDITVLVLDDEKNIRKAIEWTLEDEGLQVVSAYEPAQAIRLLQRYSIDLIILDIKLGQINGSDIFRKIRSDGYLQPVIFISGHASLSEAAEAIKIGGYDFIEKPFKADQLCSMVKDCLEQISVKNRLETLKQNPPLPGLIGDCDQITATKSQALKVAASSANVLITGESGTGKELIAQMIHHHSSRAQGPHVTVNCSAIPDGLIESELFGHEKGSFTGASGAKRGYFELAHKGSLFLDEIADLSLNAQAKILRVLETGEICRVGSEKPLKLDIRILSGTHKNLKHMIECGEFREDLYYRLCVVPIHLPPLRERGSDIVLLIEYLMGGLCKKHGLDRLEIEPEALGQLKRYHWPGNVRELKNVIERLLVMGQEKITPSCLPKEIGLQPVGVRSDGDSLKELRDNAERQLIIEAIKSNKGNISQAAKHLALSRTYLHRRISQLGIEKKDYLL